MDYKYKIDSNNVIEVWEAAWDENVDAPFLRQDVAPNTGEIWASKEDALAWLKEYLGDNLTAL